MKTHHVFTFEYSIDTPDCKIDTIIGAFKKVLPLLLAEFVKDVLLVFAEHIMKQSEKPFRCDKCGNNHHFIWKTRNAKPTLIKTIGIYV